MSKNRIPLAELAEMYILLLIECDKTRVYHDVNEILAHINKHYSHDEKARNLFKKIEDDLFQRDIGVAIKLKEDGKKNKERLN